MISSLEEGGLHKWQSYLNAASGDPLFTFPREIRLSITELSTARVLLHLYVVDLGLMVSVVQETRRVTKGINEDS